MGNLVHSIKFVFDSEKGYLKSVGKNIYQIPEYQRGYKWSSEDVLKLLHDISIFLEKNKIIRDKFYCLQNITLVSNLNGSALNVVDGQQRLTTLMVLLCRLGLEEFAKNRIEYAIRTNTQEFISKYITETNVELKSQNFKIGWENFKILHPIYDHQDIYYLYSTVVTIDTWLEEKDEEFKSKFKEGLLHHVKLIVNKVESDNEERVFGNLNSKRIPLDGADLVRAILITRVANEESEKVGDIKNIVRVNERRVRIGWELDDINTWWSKSEIKNYFKTFIKNKSEGDVKFNADKYPLNNLLLLFSEKKQKSVLNLDLIEQQESALELYKELNNLHNTLKDWYEDKQIYHYLGFIFGQTRTNFNDIFEKWESSIDRKEFIGGLKIEIGKNIFAKTSIYKIFKKEENWYKNKKLVQVLLLLDIISSNPAGRAKLPSFAFTKRNNDIEHIFPQNPEDIKEKREYIEFLNKYIVLKKDVFDLSEFELYKEEVFYQNQMGVFIDKAISEIEINSIGNLVLLYFSLNRSLGRIAYSQKRGRIIEYYNKGNFIQPHTFQVFARYFSDGNTKSFDLEHWTNTDIENNKKAIFNTIINFLKPKKKW